MSENIYDIFDDMRRFARTHPKATFLLDDNPTTQSYGWSARDSVSGDHKHWTIRLAPFKEQYRRGNDHPDHFRGIAARQEHLRLLIALARAQEPEPPVRTIWERLDDETI